MSDRKYSVGIWAYGGCGDRFSENGYQKNRSFKEKLELAAKTKNLSGVEVHYNGDFKDDDFADAKKLIKSSGLQIAAVDCETFGDRKFRKGALTSTDPKIRKDAVEIVKRAGEVAKELNAAVVNLWPGADGYDYSFQLDYEKEIELMEILSEAIPYWGRYPIPLHFNNLKKGIIASENILNIYKTLFEKIFSETLNEIKDGWDAQNGVKYDKIGYIDLDSLRNNTAT